MKSLVPRCVPRILLALLAPWPLLAKADTSAGPNPYAAGFGFDLPSEAAWGGWTRGATGTLYAEWDVFGDKSHGGAADRTAAPDLGSFGTTSAWLGWNAGTFVSGTGNLYSFTVPEIFSVNLAGTVPAVPLRVVLQVEAQGQLLDYGGFTLNDAKPTQSTQTYRNPAFPSPMGATDLVHRLFVWDLPAPPADFVFRFASKEPHVSLAQVAVDIGPQQPANPQPDPNPNPADPQPNPNPDPAGPQPDPDPSAGADRTVLAKLPAETLDAGLAARLRALSPRWFPEAWADRELAFAQRTDRGGQRITRSLKGGVPALFRDPAAGGSNRVFADIYHPDAAGDVKLAECLLKPTQIRRWKKLALESGTARFGTAVYRLDLQSVALPGKSRLRNRQGVCDIDPAAEGTQQGVPDLQEGDYAVFRREGG